MDPTTWNVPFPVVAAALFVIVMLRANGTYWLGRAVTAGASRTRLRRLVESAGFARASASLRDYGPPVVTFSFLTIGFQTLVNLAAGTTRMPLSRYLPAVTAGSVLWALLYASIGTLGVDLFGWLWSRSPALAVGISAAAILGFCGYVLWRHRHRDSSPAADS